ncbi:MAG: glycosyltransferase [Rhodobacteraceae bacterium]|nr:glycosyltransferase [Paracoccaceae bacterium]
MRARALGGRFLAVARAEGVGEALARARRHLLGRAPGELNRPAAPGASVPGHPLGAAWLELARRGAFHAARRNPGGRPAIVAVTPDTRLGAWGGRAETLAALWPGATLRIVGPEDPAAAATALQDATHLVFAGCGRSAATAALICEARRLSLPVLFDLDAPRVSLTACADQPGPGGARLVGAMPAALELMSAADAVSTATPDLAAHAALLCPRPVWLAPDRPCAADLALGARLAAAPRRPGPLRLALALCPETAEGDIAPAASALDDLLARRPEARLLIPGPVPDGLPRRLAAAAVPIPCRTREERLSALATADAVLVPLADTAYNRLRGAAPALAAAAVGRAVIASPVGALAAAVRDGETGLLARNPAEWSAALSALAAPGRAAALGAAARTRAEAEASGCAGGAADPALIAWGLS